MLPAGILDISALACAHELGGLQSPVSCPTVRTIQESTHHMKKEAKGKKGATIALQKIVSDLLRSQHHC